MSNSALGNWLGVNARSVQTYLANLKARGFIAYRSTDPREIVAQKFTPPTQEGTPPPRKNTAKGGAQNDTHIVKNNIYNNKGEKPKKEEAASLVRYFFETLPECGHVPREVAPVVAQECLQHYDANDNRTKDGRRITNWERILRAWVLRVAERTPKNNRPKREESVEDARWNEKRAVYWRKRAAALPANDPQRADFENKARAADYDAQRIRRNNG